MESFFFPRKGSSQQKRAVEYIQLNIQSTDIQNKKMFEIGVLEFYHLRKIAKDKLKVLAGLEHVVHILTNHLETFAMRYCLGHLFLSIKSNCEVSTLLLLCDVSLKLCAVDLFSNRPTTSLSSSFVFLSFPVFGLNPCDDSFFLLEVRRSRRQFFGFSF